jgi:hypothetical protein
VTTRSPRVTAGTKEAMVFAALAGGVESQSAIAVRLGLSREHVSRLAAKHRATLDAEAAKTKQAAIDGPARARQMAADATPRAIEVLLELMDPDGSGEDVDRSDGNVRLAAAKTLLDRGGVPVRTAIEATVSADPERLARLAAMLG